MRPPLISLVLLSLPALVGFGQTQPTAAPTPQPASSPVPPPSTAAKLSTAELEKLVMPIALHPDPLISVILPASVYPLEIVQAARFVKDTNNIAKVDEQPWDENVKAVAKFPDLIAKMDADLAWTMKLGQAFLDQPKELMDTIQALRAKAQSAGTLRSTPQQIVSVTNIIVLETNFTQVVTVTNQVVQVAPANPQVIYVPTYPPTVYYPPPAYVYDPVAPLVTFGVGMAVGAIIANNCDWHGGCVWTGHGDVDIDVNRDVNRNVNRNQNLKANTTNLGSQQKWQPNQSRLNSSGAPSASSREARGWGGGSQTANAGRPSPSTGMSSTRPGGGSAGGTAGARPSAGTSSLNQRAPPTKVSREVPASGSSRQASPSVNRGGGGASGSAFSGMSNGSSARNYGNRGAASRSGGFSGGGASRGGGRGGGGRR